MLNGNYSSSHATVSLASLTENQGAQVACFSHSDDTVEGDSSDSLLYSDRDWDGKPKQSSRAHKTRKFDRQGWAQRRPLLRAEPVSGFSPEAQSWRALEDIEGIHADNRSRLAICFHWGAFSLRRKKT